MSYFLPYTFQISFQIFLMYIYKIIFKTQDEKVSLPGMRGLCFSEQIRMLLP